ncbi:MAG TPA: hypothetical protein VEK07_13880 [Polyangiaceae bacterium]|nr:hypothetical protein [Polyangiaceae bacterium]
MKRSLLAITLLGAGAVLAGCPIYSDDGNYRVCTPSGCYDCPDPSLSSACIVWQCGSDTDCGSGYACQNNSCVPLSSQVVVDAGPGVSTCEIPTECPSGFTCGVDQNCHPGSCVDWGCPAGYNCFVALSTDEGECVSTVDASGLDAASPDAGDGGDAASPSVPTPCNADGQCGGGGARCINGECTPQSGLCSDGTQCSSGEACVDGVCTPHCAASNPCPIGFGCDLNRGVCSLNATVCATNAECQGGTVCVESYCVAPCAQPDAGALCPNAEVCVNGGCIPNQAASFTCKNDGYTGQASTTCDAQSICLHSDCYVQCSLDAGVDGGGGCSDPTTVCKQVTTAQGTFAVCGPPSELGSQCDPAAGTYCTTAGSLCIDGYCE